jgi:hypothetical protein
LFYDHFEASYGPFQLLGDMRGIFLKTSKTVMIPYTTQITCRQVFFVTGNVSMILNLSSLPGTREKPLEIFLGGLFEINSF